MQGLTPQALLHSDATYLVQGALGVVMLASALVAPNHRGRRGSNARARVPTANHPVAVFALGIAVTVLELPTALPYLGAVGAVTRADLR